MKVLERWNYRSAAWLGRLLADLKVNVLRNHVVNQQTFHAKRRKSFSGPMIAAGNWYLRRLGAHVRVLSDREWHAWESEVYRVTYGIELQTDANNQLLIPDWPGTSLAAILKSESNNEANQIHAIELSARSLRQLHNITLQWPDGQNRPMSHGDATAHNVIIDPTRSTASWFDFDMIHDAEMDTTWRHADDLRALISSAAEHLSPNAFSALAKTVIKSYGRSPALDALAQAVTWWQTRPISFHLAQAQLNAQNRQSLDTALLKAARPVAGI